jgi:hypothetical protein
MKNYGNVEFIKKLDAFEIVSPLKDIDFTYSKATEVKQASSLKQLKRRTTTFSLT